MATVRGSTVPYHDKSVLRKSWFGSYNGSDLPAPQHPLSGRTILTVPETSASRGAALPLFQDVGVGADV